MSREPRYTYIIVPSMPVEGGLRSVDLLSGEIRSATDVDGRCRIVAVDAVPADTLSARVRRMILGRRKALVRSVACSVLDDIAANGCAAGQCRLVAMDGDVCAEVVAHVARKHPEIATSVRPALCDVWPEVNVGQWPRMAMHHSLSDRKWRFFACHCNESDVADFVVWLEALSVARPDASIELLLPQEVAQSASGDRIQLVGYDVGSHAEVAALIESGAIDWVMCGSGEMSAVGAMMMCAGVPFVVREGSPAACFIDDSCGVIMPPDATTGEFAMGMAMYLDSNMRRAAMSTAMSAGFQQRNSAGGWCLSLSDYKSGGHEES